MKKSDFYFDLPEELIAQTPLERRDASRLLTLDKTTGAVAHHHFYELPQFLRPNDCLVLNDSRVLPARLLGHRSTGGAVEVLLLRDLGDGKWECLTRPGRKTQPGTALSFGDGELTATVIDAIADGNKIVQFHYDGIFLEVLERLGKMPLPPYIKEELEDISLRFLDPIAYEEIERMLKLKKEERERFLDAIQEKIRERLNKEGMKFFLQSRVKSIYGIYRKVYMQGRNFDEIYDVYAVRVIVDTSYECYSVLGIMHDEFTPIPKRFKDYISTPKANMYQSLHTTVLDKEGGIPFEIQIRSWEMHYTAEYGIAAHWKYKAGIEKKDKLEERLAWVRQLLEVQQDSGDAQDIVRSIKSDIAPEECFVFTPKGDVINLPTGSTVIDFAYAIHSEVGNRMTGAKVDGRIVPLDFKLETGMIVEIITSKGPGNGPSRDWLKIVKTSEARTKIRAWFKKERREENIITGKEELEREFKRNLINVPENELEDFVLNLAKRQHRFLRSHRLRWGAAVPFDAKGQGGVPKDLPQRSRGRKEGSAVAAATCCRRQKTGQTDQRCHRGRTGQLSGQICKMLQPAAGRPDCRIYHPRVRRVHPQAGLCERAELPCGE